MVTKKPNPKTITKMKLEKLRAAVQLIEQEAFTTDQVLETMQESIVNLKNSLGFSVKEIAELLQKNGAPGSLSNLKTGISEIIKNAPNFDTQEEHDSLPASAKFVLDSLISNYDHSVFKPDNEEDFNFEKMEEFLTGFLPGISKKMQRIFDEAKEKIDGHAAIDLKKLVDSGNIEDEFIDDEK
jgi:DNA-binding transcriptional MerR regulator